VIEVRLPGEIEECARKRIMSMLDEAEAESERDGWVSMEEMNAGLHRIIENVEQRHRG
jgi:hypothetical protein